MVQTRNGTAGTQRPSPLLRIPKLGRIVHAHQLVGHLAAPRHQHLTIGQHRGIAPIACRGRAFNLVGHRHGPVDEQAGRAGAVRTDGQDLTRRIHHLRSAIAHEILVQVVQALHGAIASAVNDVHAARQVDAENSVVLRQPVTRVVFANVQRCSLGLAEQFELPVCTPHFRPVCAAAAPLDVHVCIGHGGDRGIPTRVH